MSEHPSANVFVLIDFNLHHIEWLKHLHGTDRPKEYSFKFSVTHNPTQTDDFPTRTPDSDTHRPAFLDLLDLVEDLVSLHNSDYVVISVSVDFAVTSTIDALYHRKGFGYKRVDD